MLKFKAGIPVAAPMCGKLPEALLDHQPAITRKYLYHALTSVTETLLLADELNILQPGSTNGNIIACNLTVLNSLCGTPYLPNFNNAILVLEDINEDPYKFDRSMTQLEQCGILALCKGVIFGSFTACGDDEAVLAIQHKYAAMVNGPVFAGLQFGHTFPMIAIRNGAQVKMTPSGSLQAIK
jgi:muramoyltetrapeptide carboxypeptidase